MTIAYGPYSDTYLSAAQKAQIANISAKIVDLQNIIAACADQITKLQTELSILTGLSLDETTREIRRRRALINIEKYELQQKIAEKDINKTYLDILNIRADAIKTCLIAAGQFTPHSSSSPTSTSSSSSSSLSISSSSTSRPTYVVYPRPWPLTGKRVYAGVEPNFENNPVDAPTVPEPVAELRDLRANLSADGTSVRLTWLNRPGVVAYQVFMNTDLFSNPSWLKNSPLSNNGIPVGSGTNDPLEGIANNLVWVGSFSGGGTVGGPRAVTLSNFPQLTPGIYYFKVIATRADGLFDFIDCHAYYEPDSAPYPIDWPPEFPQPKLQINTKPGALYYCGKDPVWWNQFLSVNQNTLESKRVNVPVRIGDRDDWVDVSGTFLINTAGELYAWGYSNGANTYTKLSELDANIGINPRGQYPIPRRIGTKNNWQKLSANGRFAITTDGDLYERCPSVPTYDFIYNLFSYKANYDTWAEPGTDLRRIMLPGPVIDAVVRDELTYILLANGDLYLRNYCTGLPQCLRLNSRGVGSLDPVDDGSLYIPRKVTSRRYAAIAPLYINGVNSTGLALRDDGRLCRVLQNYEVYPTSLYIDPNTGMWTIGYKTYTGKEPSPIYVSPLTQYELGNPFDEMPALLGQPPIIKQIRDGFVQDVNGDWYTFHKIYPVNAPYIHYINNGRNIVATYAALSRELDVKFTKMSFPEKIIDITPSAPVTAGGGFAISESGNVYGWGRNVGNLGDGTTISVDIDKPILIPRLRGAVKINAAWETTYAIIPANSSRSSTSSSSLI